MHGMIDLETLGTSPDTVILTLGAIKFDPYTDVEPHSGLYLRCDIEEQSEELGRTIDDNTMEWWTKQPQNIQDEAFGEHKDRVDMDQLTKALNKFCVGVDQLWCQGPLFDYAILQNLYAQLGHPVPWQYWQIRDSRTLFSLVPKDLNEKRTGLHNALEDCYFQARKVQQVYNQLDIKNPSKY